MSKVQVHDQGNRNEACGLLWSIFSEQARNAEQKRRHSFYIEETCFNTANQTWKFTNADVSATPIKEPDLSILFQIREKGGL